MLILEKYKTLLNFGISSAVDYPEAETVTSLHGASQRVTKKSLLDKYYEWRDPQKALSRRKAKMTIGALDGFSGASRSRKSLASWRVKSGDSGEVLLTDYSALVDRSYDLDRNNPMAHGALSTLSDNIVGTGLRVQSQIDADFLGLSDEQADAWQKDAERVFNIWANSKMCDAKSEQTFSEMQATAFLSCLLSGDVFAQRQFINNREFLGTCWRLIDSKRISNPDYNTDSRRIAGGIERDSFGVPSWYHIASANPGSIIDPSVQWRRYRRMAADGMNLDILHAYRKRTINEPRGRPVLAPVIEAFKQLGRYLEAELQAAVVSGLFTVFIQSPDGNAELDFYDGSDEESSPLDSNYEMGNGAIVGLAEGETINTANPGRPNSGFDQFVLSVLRQIGVALGLPYELVIKHFTASYSASRAALNEAQRSFKQRRRWFGDSFCQPIYESVIIEAVAKGRLQAPGFFADYETRQAYLKSLWVGDAWGSLDPVKDVTAAEKRLDLGLTTRTQETLEINGGDYEKNVSQRMKEKDFESNLGVIENASITEDEPNPLGDNDRELDDDSENSEP
jgi:lambda family phage portal protein